MSKIIELLCEKMDHRQTDEVKPVYPYNFVVEKGTSCPNNTAISV